MKDNDGLVVTGQTVDTGLDENQAELGVLVLAVALEVLADGNSLRGDTSADRARWKLRQDKQTFLMSM